MVMDTNTTSVLTLAITALSGMGMAYIAFRQAKLATKISVVADDVLRVEKATNSHTDLLVAATKAAAHSAGKEEGRLEQREYTTAKAEGAAESADTPIADPEKEG